jgi:hypothetical protein
MFAIALRRRRGESGPNLPEMALVTPLLLLPALHRVPLCRRPLHSFTRFPSH